MSGHAEHQRKGVAGTGATLSLTASAPRNALADAPLVQALAATGRMLNARPALVAQRRLAADLARAPRMAPVQRMNNGQPPPAVVEEEEWGDYQGAPQPAPGGNANLPAAAANPPAAADNAVVVPANPVVVAVNVPAANQPAANANQIAAPANPAANAVNPVPAANVAANPAPANAIAVAAAVPAAVGAAAQVGNGAQVGTGGHAEANGPMFTVGLVNCVALVAYDAGVGLACLYHWNTADGGLTIAERDDDADEGAPDRFAPDPAGINVARDRVRGRVANVTAYHAVLGTGWDVGPLADVQDAFRTALDTSMPGITIAAALHGSAQWAAPNLVGY